jgi:menaquinol-cytochrome c reductase iron-sulfur subunit
MPDNGRRRFLGLLTAFLMGLLALVVAFPAVAYFLAPLRRNSGAGGLEPAFQDIGPIADLPLGEWRLVSLEIVQADGWKKSRVRHALWVRREADGKPKVLSSICTHLGCPINWHPDQSQFFCPCHGGVFDPNGRQISGPPPRAMDSLEYEVREGRLWVRWQDFKIGVAERVSVNV